MSGFEGFRDTPEAPFYRSGAMSPEQTWAEAALRLSRLLHSAARAARQTPTDMTAKRICGWHRAIFLTTFPRDAGKVRSDDKPVAFSVPVEIGGEVKDMLMQGTASEAAILQELDAACESFNTHIASLQNRGDAVVGAEGAIAPAKFYSAILKTHPFVDGNLRAAYVALIVGLATVGLPIVEFRVALKRHDECLGWAMRDDGGRTIDPLVQLIVELVRDVEADTGGRYP